MRLTAFTDVDAFSAIPSYLAILFGTPAERNEAVAALDSINGLPGLLALLGGDPNFLLADDEAGIPGYDALSAIQVFFGDDGVFGSGDVDALEDYDVVSAVPSYIRLAQATSVDDAIDALGEIDNFSALPVFRDVANADSLIGNSPTSVASALGGYDALSAADTFFGDGPVGQDETPIGGVFTGGGIDALAPADDEGGYAALSALPVFFGTNPNGPFGEGVFTGGGVGALGNYDALSAIPAYLDPAPPMMLAAASAEPQLKVAEDPVTTTPPAASNPVRKFVANLPKPPAAFTPPAPEAVPAVVKEEPKAELEGGDNGSSNEQNVQRTSEKFTPKGVNGKPILFGSGGNGVDNGIRGWGDALKKIGLGGGGEGAEGGKGAEGAN